MSNNRAIPGIRQESAVDFAGRLPPLRPTPQTAQPGTQHVAQPAHAPTRVPVRPPSARNLTAQIYAKPKRHTALSGITKIRLFLIGGAIVLADAYLGFHFMKITFPAVDNPFLQVAPTLIFTGSQVGIFARGKALYALVVLVALSLINIAFNAIALSDLLKSDAMAFTLQGAFIWTVAAASGVVGEIMIGITIED